MRVFLLLSGGMIGPMLGGTLIGINASFPVYASAVFFMAGAVCALALPFETADEVQASDKEATEYRLLQ